LRDYFVLNFLSVVIAFALDDVFSDPRTKYHPACLMGRFNRALESVLYPLGFLGGMLLTLISIFVFTATAGVALYFAFLTHKWLFIGLNSVVIYFAISAKSMTQHALNVYNPLVDNDIVTARHELSMIVSRDTEQMDEESIVRSTVESVSENYTDGVLSPAFYAVIFGGVGAVFFKAVSTLDSMIGYKNEKYLAFGKFAAIFDDVLNFIPARLSVLVIALAAGFKGIGGAGVFRSAWLYRKAHESPNSAHSMSAFAGALNIRLGGAVSYFGKLKEKPYIGDGKRELEPEIIKEAVKLFETSTAVAMFACVGAYFVLKYL
jgi:adenosylcobinamide-phosphate synthase